MNSVYELLENRGLATEKSILERYPKWSPQEVTELNLSLDNALRQEKQKLGGETSAASEFRFLASASFRGDSGCDAMDCRVASTRALAKYAALYCDEVIFPVRASPAPVHEGGDRFSDYNLAGTLLCLRELRPLVEAGVVRLVPTSLYLCDACARRLFSEVSVAEKSVRRFIEKTAKAFSVYRAAVPPEFPGILLEIRGPDAFLQHGRQFTMFVKAPAWAENVKAPRSSTGRVKLPNELVRRAGILEGTFSRFVADAAVHSVYGARYQAKYLTNLPGEAAIISRLNELPPEDAGVNALLTKLTHRIPFLDDLHAQEILRLRGENREPFEQYRLALGKIIREYVKTRKQLSGTEADEIYADILAPALARLQTVAREHRRSSRSKAVKSALYAAALITVGAYAGHLSAPISTMLETLTGAELLRSTVDTISSVERDSSAARSDNFYFLFRLLRQAA